MTDEQVIHKERPLWSVPREWEGQRSYVVCGGPSFDSQQRSVAAKLRKTGRWIVVKQSVEFMPDADVMIVGNKEDPHVLKRHIAMYTGPRLVARSWYHGMPDHTLFLRRHKSQESHDGMRMPLSKSPHHLAGLDTGASAINLAYLFGSPEIVVIGMDMTGGHWMKNHPLQNPPQQHFRRHIRTIETMAEDLEAEGVKVWNASPTSVLTCWPKRRLEEWL